MRYYLAKKITGNCTPVKLECSKYTAAATGAVD